MPAGAVQRVHRRPARTDPDCANQRGRQPRRRQILKDACLSAGSAAATSTDSEHACASDRCLHTARAAAFASRARRTRTASRYRHHAGVAGNIFGGLFGSAPRRSCSTRRLVRRYHKINMFLSERGRRLRELLPVPEHPDALRADLRDRAFRLNGWCKHDICSSAPELSPLNMRADDARRTRPASGKVCDQRPVLLRKDVGLRCILDVTLYRTRQVLHARHVRLSPGAGWYCRTDPPWAPIAARVTARAAISRPPKASSARPARSARRTIRPRATMEARRRRRFSATRTARPNARRATSVSPSALPRTDAVT